MAIEMEIGGASYRLDPAAISAVRYRCAYGESILNQLQRGGTDREIEGALLRMLHMMIPPGERPELLDFARAARRDPDFLKKALTAQELLLAPDPQQQAPETPEAPERFDEYRFLALMAELGVGQELLYELPILHLSSVINRVIDLRDPERKSYRHMTQTEMETLYPR